MTDQTPETTGAEAQVQYTRWLMQLRADMAETVGGVLLRGARPVQVVGDSGRWEEKTPATQWASSSPATLVGYSISAPGSGDTDKAYIRDGGPDGPIVLEIVFNGLDRTITNWFGPGGISFSQGIYFECPDAAARGSIFLRGSDY